MRALIAASLLALCFLLLIVAAFNPASVQSSESAPVSDTELQVIGDDVDTTTNVVQTQYQQTGTATHTVNTETEADSNRTLEKKKNKKITKGKKGNKRASTPEPIHNDPLNPPPTDSSLLALLSHSFNFLFGSVAAAHFLPSHWEQLPLHTHRNTTQHFKHLLQLSDLDELFNTSISVEQAFKADSEPFNHSLVQTDLKVVKRVFDRGSKEWWTGNLPYDQHKDHPLTASLLHHLFTHHNFTIVMNRLNYRWPSLAHFCSLLQNSVFGFRVNANLYLTPPFEQQGFEVHYDWMESFVLQMAGNKQWSIYDSELRLPRRDQVHRPKHVGLNATLDQPEEIVITPGDTLYFPSGVVHQARTGVNFSEASLHVTIGVEIDSYEMFQGLMQLQAEGVRNEKKYDEQLTKQLNTPLPSFSCSDTSSTGNLHFSDLLQLYLHTASSAVPNFLLRKSLYGIHHLLRGNQSQPVQSFYRNVHRTTGIIINQSLLNNSERALETVIEYVTQLHEKLSAESEATKVKESYSSVGSGQHSKLSRKHQTDHSAQFSDPYLSPLLNQTLNSTFFKQLKSANQSSDKCRNDYVEQVQKQFNVVLQRFIALIQPLNVSQSILQRTPHQALQPLTLHTLQLIHTYNRQQRDYINRLQQWFLKAHQKRQQDYRDRQKYRSAAELKEQIRRHDELQLELSVPTVTRTSKQETKQTIHHEEL